MKEETEKLINAARIIEKALSDGMTIYSTSVMHINLTEALSDYEASTKDKEEEPEAIEFAEWILKHCTQVRDGNADLIWEDDITNKEQTSSQLYKLWKDNNQKIKGHE